MFVKMLYCPPSSDGPTWRRESYAMTLEFQDIGNLSSKELNDMIDRNIIIDLNSPGGKMFYDSFELNPRFIKKFSLNVVSWASEIVDMYPRFFHMEGKKYNAITISAQDIAETYLKAIDKNPEMHEEVKSCLKWASENDCIKMGVEKFIKTKQWLSIKLLKSDAKRTVNESKLG